MQLFKLSKLLSVIIGVFFVNAFYCVSQDIDCPGDFVTPEHTTVSFEPFPYEVWGSVEIDYRENAGRIEVKADWSTLTEYNNVYDLDEKELKECLTKAIIQYLAGECPWEGTKEIVFYEVTECKLTKKCWLDVIDGSEVYCVDEGWPGPDPEYYEYENNKYYIYGKRFHCGYNCCEKIYTVECQYDSGLDEDVPKVTTVTSGPYQGAECQSDEDVYDCRTGDKIPCKVRCK